MLLQLRYCSKLFQIQYVTVGVIVTFLRGVFSIHVPYLLDVLVTLPILLSAAISPGIPIVEPVVAHDVRLELRQSGIGRSLLLSGEARGAARQGRIRHKGLLTESTDGIGGTSHSATRAAAAAAAAGGRQIGPTGAANLIHQLLPLHLLPEDVVRGGVVVDVVVPGGEVAGRTASVPSLGAEDEHPGGAAAFSRRHIMCRLPIVSRCNKGSGSGRKDGACRRRCVQRMQSCRHGAEEKMGACVMPFHRHRNY